MTFFLGLCLTTLVLSPSANALTNARIVLHDGSSIVADIVAYRGGDVVMGWFFAGLTHGLGMSMFGVGLVGAGIAGLWGCVGVFLGRSFSHMPADHKT